MEPAPRARGRVALREQGERLLVALRRRHPRIGALRLLARPRSATRQPRASPACAEMMRDRVRIGCGRRRHRLRDLPVPRPPPRQRHPFVQRLPDQGVGEADRRSLRRLVQHARRHRPLDRDRAASPRPPRSPPATASSGTSCPITAASASNRSASAPKRISRRSISCRRSSGTRARLRSPSVQPSSPCRRNPSSSSVRTSSPRKSGFPSERTVRYATRRRSSASASA